jgi:hypothetical protein
VYGRFTVTREREVLAAIVAPEHGKARLPKEGFDLGAVKHVEEVLFVAPRALEILHHDLRVLMLLGGKTTHEDIRVGHPVQFRQGHLWVLDVLQDTTREHNIKGVVGKR